MNMGKKAPAPKHSASGADSTDESRSPNSSSTAGIAENIGSISTLKALAHPIRQRLFRALIAREHARATDLAAALDIPANKVSFHLRVLADAQIIEEAPEHARDKRDRVWKPKSGSWDLGSPERPVEDEALASDVAAWFAADLHSTIERLVAWAPEYTSGRTHEIHGSLVTAYLWLTDEEFAQLTDALGTTLNEYHGRKKEEGRRRWQVSVVAADEEI